VAVNEESGALFGGFIVNAKDIEAMHDMSVLKLQSVGSVPLPSL
jgi:predicted secreted protein